MVSIRAGFTFTAEDEEMLNAAHAAMYFWSIVGNANNQAHAAQLLAHTYAVVKQPKAASHYLDKCLPMLAGESAKPWERAMAHAVAANVASAGSNTQDHKRHYQEATRLTAALENAEERAIIEATLRVLPVPTSVCTSVD